MTQTDDTTPLSFLTHFNATERDVLPEARPVLLGTFLAPSGGKALVRDPQGNIRTIGLGDHIGRARVTRIGDGKLTVMLMGETYALSVPGRA